MPFDALAVAALRQEYQQTLVNGRIDRIFQPDREKVVFSVFHPFPRRDLWLLFSVHPRFYRSHLINKKPVSHREPPAFCMLLRKYLQGGRFLEVSRPSSERILHFKIENYYAEEGLTVFTLVFEAIGRFANLLLVDGEGRILDALKRLPDRDGESRRILPGAIYTPPPTPAGRNLETLTAYDLRLIIDRSPSERSLRQILVEEILGVSPFLAAEVLHRAGLDPKTTAGSISPEDTPVYAEKIHTVLGELHRQIEAGRIHPYCYKKNGQPVDFFPYRPLSLPESALVPAASLSRAVAETLDRREYREELALRQRKLLKIITRAKKKAEKKAQKQREELAQAEDADHWRLYGELLTAYRHQVPRGAGHVELANYYDPEGKTVTIPLDPSLSANQNAQNYYKKYAKAKKGRTRIAAELEKTKEELAYLESLENSLQNDLDLEELAAVEEEMQGAGLTKGRRLPGRPRQSPGGRPALFRSSEGWEIMVGKNNRQNDQLTFKLSSPRDLWFHTQKIPGSHVLLRCGGKEVGKEALLEAANLAAYFSKARHSSKVPVDYTERRHVRKPAGARPGFVLYKNFQTLTITPDPAVLKRLGIEAEREQTGPK
ncbi:MAG: fibronectin-binding domain-containing protein [Firmicutes bacterium]|nr:fibronectin-binding domain-containing protein [Bacillota bacterium]